MVARPAPLATVHGSCRCCIPPQCQAHTRPCQQMAKPFSPPCVLHTTRYGCCSFKCHPWDMVCSPMVAGHAHIMLPHGTSASKSSIHHIRLVHLKCHAPAVQAAIKCTAFPCKWRVACQVVQDDNAPRAMGIPLLQPLSRSNVGGV